MLKMAGINTLDDNQFFQMIAVLTIGAKKRRGLKQIVLQRSPALLTALI